MKPRILIIRLSALGDVIHGLPVLAALRAAMPDAQLDWLVEDRAADLLRGHPLLDRLHVMPRRELKRMGLVRGLRGPVRELAERLRRENYNTAIDLQGLTKSAVWAGLSRAPERIGFAGRDAREASRFFYNVAVDPEPERHVVRRNLRLLEPLGVRQPAVEFPVHLPDAAMARGAEIWGRTVAGVAQVVMNPGAGWPTKQWPAANFGRLASRLARERGARVALAWGPGEEGLVWEALEAAGAAVGKPGGRASAPAEPPDPLPAEPGVYMLPRTTFLELGGVLAHAQLYVGGDTGPTHLATALGVPAVALFGASDAKRNAPLGAPTEVIQLDTPPCIPCWQTRCTWKEPLACLTHIQVERVEAACGRLLERRRPAEGARPEIR